MGAKIEVFFTKLYKKILFRNVLLLTFTFFLCLGLDNQEGEKDKETFELMLFHPEIKKIEFK